MQNEYKIRAPETEKELEQYYQFRYEQLRKPSGQLPGSERDDLEDIAIHRMIIDASNKIVATGRLHFNNEKEGQVKQLAVDNSSQKKGLGSKILEELEKVAKEKGAEEMVIHGREDVLPFYLKNGYKVIKDSYAGVGGIKHIETRKKL